MAPNGNIYYPEPALFKEDFSVGSGQDFISELKIFIHEMVHVWQR